MFMVGCQIIVLDDEYLVLFTAPINVPDIIKDIFPIISFMDMFWFIVLVDLSILSSENNSFVFTSKISSFGDLCPFNITGNMSYER